ncbi:hypothetical protein [Anaerocolumna sp. MB42-C2]|uniref:hypothetical protein n=1 Tax=Anaerocolumna sp. MB42-C2 TaxID=3070997 RepID=UPI0027DEE4A7|nr:hypothetical protein [Anaerocolumna sp. MB42-C2]WMJ87982.1 hypothetical protein RBU59_00300 [Anaerocolumna sp. MB42-C2]
MKLNLAKLVTLMLIITTLITGCGNRTSSADNINDKSAATRVITDASGREVEIPEFYGSRITFVRT